MVYFFCQNSLSSVVQKSNTFKIDIFKQVYFVMSSLRKFITKDFSFLCLLPETRSDFSMIKVSDGFYIESKEAYQCDIINVLISVVIFV